MKYEERLRTESLHIIVEKEKQECMDHEAKIDHRRKCSV